MTATTITANKAGDRYFAERSFTLEDVRAFTVVSGDAGRQHVELDDKGRLQVHGLLTATIFTEIGGRLNYIAREMGFEFIRPVFTGDTITVELTIDRVEEEPERTALSATAVGRNQHGKEVLKSRTNGVIFKMRS